MPERWQWFCFIAYIVIALAVMAWAFWADEVESFMGLHFLVGMFWPMSLFFCIIFAGIEKLETFKKRHRPIEAGTEREEYENDNRPVVDKIPTGPGRWKEE